MPTLYLTCGLAGSGKTSLAKTIEQEAHALRFTGDDWMHKLYPGISTPEAETGPYRSRVESLQWKIALHTLRLQCNVVVDWGVWSQAERGTCRGEARAYGARVVLCFLDVPFQELWNRLPAKYRPPRREFPHCTRGPAEVVEAVRAAKRRGNDAL